MKKIVFLSVLCLVLASCSPASSLVKPVQQAPVVFAPATATQAPTATEAATATAIATVAATAQVSAPAKVPDFDHIVLIMLENEYYQDVIGNAKFPHLNALAKQNVVLSNYFAIGHPSLPNFLALVSGSTQGVNSDCSNCFVDQPNLADEIEASGRTWKSYQEGMPSDCFVGETGTYYVQWRNPFIYFDSIRLDKTRCDSSIVPLSQLNKDLAANQLPNFSLIMPNLCDSGHSCAAETADNWVNGVVANLLASRALGQNSLIVITFDEGVERSNGLPAGSSGQIAAVLISPMARQGFVDPTLYSHYSLLKTILTAWNLPALGNTAQDSIQPIAAPWDTQFGQ